MGEGRKIQWYVGPKEGYTNQSVVEYLGHMLRFNIDNPAKKLQKIQDSHGVSQDVFGIPHEVIVQAKKGSHLFFRRMNVFNKKEGDACIRECKFSK